MSDQFKPYHIALLHALSKFVSAIIAGLTAMIAWTTSALDRTDTARKRAEEEETFRKLFALAPYALIIVNKDGTIVLANNQAEKLFGYTQSELCGKTVELLVPERFRGSHTQHRAGFFTNPHARNMGTGFDLYALRKDGAEFPVDVSLAPFETKEGTLVTAAIRDVTERKRLEEQFRQSQKMEAVGRLAGGIAHDFNNLLTVIMGYSQIFLSRLGPDDPLRTQVEEIKTAGERAAALTNQLLAFSRKQVRQPRVLDLNAVVANMDRMLQRVIGEDIELHTALRSELERVKADPGHIEQIIMNLAVNARDAMPDGGMLTIETANVELDAAYARTHVAVTPGRYVMLAVSDTGCGMDEETQRHVFEPFFTTKEKGTGTGLGLSTVYGIVKQSAGYIWVYSEPRQGATFKVYLPSVKEPAETVEPRMPSAQSPRGSETVLLVEDEEGVRVLARAVLEANGYTVLAARNGTEAFPLSGQHTGPIHLLLTDVVMPGMSGRELAECLRSARPTLKILYVSGYPDDTIVRHGILDSNVAFLQKPFTPLTLARKVREVLDVRGREVSAESEGK